MERYNRQVMIDKIGKEGQKRLAKASVAVIGVGGLGSPILTYLALAGVGRLTIIDYDCVEMSNLNRQFLHGTEDVGALKVESAKRKLNQMNHEVEINPLAIKLTKNNGEGLLSGHDLVMGALDSTETRFIVNEACVNLGIPYIDGGVKEFGGSVVFTNPPDTPCYNCVFPKKVGEKERVGVLGVTAGIIGAIEADIAIIYLLGLANPLKDKILVVDGLRLSMNLVDIVADDMCEVCGLGS